jgi:circadian clock protein KaiC
VIGTAQKSLRFRRKIWRIGSGASVTARKGAAQHLPKLATGIKGFDQLSGGGLPRNRTTLVMGGPGTGKTVFALQTLIDAARERKQPGIFVAFEEAPKEIFANAAAFGWPLSALARSAVYFLDARLSPAVVQSGDFELTGMLAVLEAKKQELGAVWIVLDGIDVLLSLLRNPGTEMREIYRVRDWLAHNGLTAIVTAKLDGDSSQAMNYGFMQFMVDCVVHFDRRLEQGVPVRRLEITKFRGSDFSAGEFPVNFGSHGMDVAAPAPVDVPREASVERVSTGFRDLDSMLGGGLFRGSTTLVTGAPGTSKTTLAGQFAASACRRGERALFVSFDEGGERIRRNLTSVGIHLDAHVQSGLLRMYSGSTDAGDPEEHLIRIASLILDHRPRCIVIDPLSAIARTGALSSARAAGNRLLCKIRDRNLTTFITSLVDGDDPQAEATELQISTIADTWIHLSYLVRGGERNRALTIIKSRGTAHSNQVRELVLSSKGPTLVDAYSAGGEVLMGTLRWEKEAEERTRKLQRRAQYSQKRRELQLAEADIIARMAALQVDLERQRAELALYTRDDEARQASLDEWENELRRKRSVNSPATASAVPRKGRIPRNFPNSRANGGKGRQGVP